MTTLIKDCRYRCAGAGGGQAEVYLTFSSRFERIWLESNKRLPQYMEQKPANIGLRSQYALRLYSSAKKHAAAREKKISLEELRKVLGLDSVKDDAGNIIREAPLQLWANFRQRALDTAIAEINEKTDLNIALESLGRSKHRRVTSVTFAPIWDRFAVFRAAPDQNSIGFPVAR